MRSSSSRPAFFKLQKCDDCGPQNCCACPPLPTVLIVLHQVRTVANTDSFLVYFQQLTQTASWFTFSSLHRQLPGLLSSAYTDSFLVYFHHLTQTASWFTFISLHRKLPGLLSEAYTESFLVYFQQLTQTASRYNFSSLHRQLSGLLSAAYRDSFRGGKKSGDTVPLNKFKLC